MGYGSRRPSRVPLLTPEHSASPGLECMCEVKGSLSGVGECQEGNGECFCKPNICSHACDTCQDGYFLLQKKNYFGCQGCQCDVGGAVSNNCDESTGQCKCRKHMQGRTCSEPELNFYLPTLHHLKFEVEAGITPNARQVRFGYDPQEFPQFSWRGYAVLTPAQSFISGHRTLPTERCSQDTAHRMLPTGRCPQDAAHRTLPTGHCPQDAAHRTLPTGHCPQDAAHRTLLPR
ncbi:hypothetical protein NFI96_000699 [Prochilodus magdalenae]|nr:hypothetical protein NFI96_000699 [Prochilodus magdalenae]